MPEKYPAKYIPLATLACLGMSALLQPVEQQATTSHPGLPVRPNFCAMSSEAILGVESVASITNQSCNTTEQGFSGYFSVALHDGQEVTVILKKTAHAALSATTLLPLPLSRLSERGNSSLGTVSTLGIVDAVTARVSPTIERSESHTSRALDTYGQL